MPRRPHKPKKLRDRPTARPFKCPSCRYLHEAGTGCRRHSNGELIRKAEGNR